MTAPQTIDVEENRREMDRRQREQLHARIEHDFTYHAPSNRESVERHQQINTTLAHTAHVVADLVPPGREQSLAITKLEEARFWANAAIARREDH